MDKMYKNQSKAMDYMFYGDCEEDNDDFEGSFAKAVVEISKLLVERWLQTDRGRKFHADIDNTDIEDPEKRVRDALKTQGINLASWITPQVDPDSRRCYLECDSSKPGFALIWHLPYESWDPAEVSKDKLQKWIDKCDEWLADEKWKDAEPDFPETPSMYIPLATT